MSGNWQVSVGEWAELQEAACSIRDEVFVGEQNVPAELEHDGMDPACRHVIVRDAAGEAIATGRLLPDGHIGRIAVRASWRGKGVGNVVVTALIQDAKAGGHRELVLSSQTHAVPFYAKLGFEAYGEEFMEAGIPHLSMRMLLPA